MTGCLSGVRVLTCLPCWCAQTHGDGPACQHPDPFDARDSGRHKRHIPLGPGRCPWPAACAMSPTLTRATLLFYAASVSPSAPLQTQRQQREALRLLRRGQCVGRAGQERGGGAKAAPCRSTFCVSRFPLVSTCAPLRRAATADTRGPVACTTTLVAATHW